MKPIKTWEIETTNARFDLKIYKKPDGSGFVGKYDGIKPKFLQIKLPGNKVPAANYPNGEVTDPNIEQVEKKCRAKIVEFDGEIIKSTEL